ncbi:PP2C family protein-serine/threonine phosphatase [candidate division KSB1 bacterium]
MAGQNTKQNTPDPGKKPRQKIIDGIHNSNLRKTFKKGFRETFYFYIDSKKRVQLAKAGWLKKWLYTNWWFFKSVILKLTPVRRVLFLGGFALFWASFSADTGNALLLRISFLLFLFIILLELKDKLFAQDELAVGGEVQSALMPDENPMFPGWDIWIYNSPAKEVSGDLIDFVRLSDNRLGLALGDVAGKGLGAALLMARLQASLIALVPIIDSFAELGRQLNHIFCRDCLPNKFASLVYIEIDSGKGDIRLFNAGHLPPIMIKGGKLEEMPKGQPALGLTDASVYEEQQTKIEPGEILLAYSDGLTEAVNEDGEFFGDERLSNLLLKLENGSASDTGNRIIEEIGVFTGYAQQSDDISIIVLKRKN